MQTLYKRLLQYKYIPEQCENQLKSYKYNGIDNSILYNYIFGPLAEQFLRPNTVKKKIQIYNIKIQKITLIGFICVMIPHLLILWIAPGDESKDIPKWLIIFTGIMHLVYMNFDNMDGKQARKTGNSSPLGLLIDHGCDALIVTIQGMSLSACVGFGNSYLMYSLNLCGSVPFFITTLDEYYTDIMYLPLINGAAEGCFSIGVVYLFTAYMGNEYWLKDSIWGLKNNSITVIGFYAASVFATLNILYRIYQVKGFETLKKLIKNTSQFFFIHFTITYIFAFSPSNVSLQQTRILTYISALCWCRVVVINKQKKKFKKFIFKIVNNIIVSRNTVYGNIFGKCLVCEATLLYIVFIVCLLCNIKNQQIIYINIFKAYAHLVYNGTNQLCDILKIKVFRVKQKILENKKY
ncbi:hypothetical protein IMG5_139110 [Ichthyophthirius multifiliis]|uniref:Ethanolaminephosphotransferase n=1 Tax=Ichthyophthirius multifiliis TaxID=5932 RepID=G0QX81_ICHMU|nr:hypothetical protein IMG5_139110 [Ichthyophthirius multifiliis]EGR30174.1 hypothetical protein IMG5_139110 [Ichthyophthirius multifiliis]|eukprot:XP_004031410.1 hypothetical protein IMG5_139110 [Ichthyophthirius multifiliis]